MRFFLAYFSRYRPNTRDDPVVSQWCSSPPLVHVLGGKLRVADYAKASGFPDRFTRVTWVMPHADPPPEGGRRNAVAGRWVRHIDLPENRDPWDAPIRNDVT